MCFVGLGIRSSYTKVFFCMAKRAMQKTRERVPLDDSDYDILESI